MKKNQIEFHVWGRYALFSDPVTRMGGEKSTYLAPTYQALKGIMESIVWKPTIIWVIDAVRIMSPIRTQSKNIRPISYNSPKNDLSIYTYLTDVSYQVRAHFIFNENRPDLAADRNEGKYYNIACRMVEKGGRRDIFLGTRECQGYVEPCVFGEGKGYYDGYGEMDFGVMVHGFDYPDDTGRKELSVRLWRQRMVDGVIMFPPPWACDSAMRQYIRPMYAKVFSPGLNNFSGLNEPAIAAILEEGGGAE